MKYRTLGLLLFASVLSLTCTACGGAAGSSVTGSSRANAASASSSPSGRLFPNAGWLYRAPSGSNWGLASYHAKVSIDAHDGGFDYPIQYTDGSNGTMTFSDGSNQIAVPIPAGGFYPSTGAWGANDGHLVVIDTSRRMYFDFWKLLTDGHGHPRSTHVGKIVSGSLDGDGSPGTTAANLTGAAGDLMPGELQSGIHHALSCVVPGNWNNASLGDQAPVSKTDGRGNGPLSEGGKLGIDPKLNVDALPVGAGTKNLMKALQQYGCVVTDQSGGTGIAIYSDLPNLKGVDLSGMDQIGRYLRFYF